MSEEYTSEKQFRALHVTDFEEPRISAYSHLSIAAGRLINAHEVPEKATDPDEEQIRRELSENLLYGHGLGYTQSLEQRAQRYWTMKRITDYSIEYLDVIRHRQLAETASRLLELLHESQETYYVAAATTTSHVRMPRLEKAERVIVARLDGFDVVGVSRRMDSHIEPVVYTHDGSRRGLLPMNVRMIETPLYKQSNLRAV